jgi:tRNA-binding EMAP/Myf-like protein
VLAGIAEHYTRPFVGRKVVVVANQPAKLMGVN